MPARFVYTFDSEAGAVYLLFKLFVMHGLKFYTAKQAKQRCERQKYGTYNTTVALKAGMWI